MTTKQYHKMELMFLSLFAAFCDCNGNA